MNLTIAMINHTKYNIQGVSDFLNEIASILEFKKEIEMSIVFCNNPFIQDLNSQFRQQDKVTDVLSFPAHMDFILGDVIISIEKAQEQAQGTLAEELEMLLCHGFLHLLNYDHEKSDEDHEIMMNLQELLLKKKQSRIIIE